MPQLGLEVSEAAVLEVLVAVGDAVVVGEPLLEVETEKATTEVVAPCDGFVLAINVREGDSIGVGAVALYLGESPDEAVGSGDSDRGASESRNAIGSDARNRSARDETVSASPAGAESAEEADPARRRAAPVARRAAHKLGIDLSLITGSGPRGRITLRDVESAAENRVAAVSDPVDPSLGRGQPAADDLAIEPLSKVRAAMARRMAKSQLIPQYHLEREVDATHLLAQKTAAAAAVSSGPQPGINDLLIQAIARTVIDHPALALEYVDGDAPGVRRHTEIGVGLAVASDIGLLVPVIQRVDRLGLAQITSERTALVDAARQGRLSLQQMTGAVITLSNLGAFGIGRFSAMLNTGESAIVAVGRVSDRVVPRGRSLNVVPTLVITMTFDHRTVDGAVGAAALTHLAELLEGQMSWRP